MMRIHQHWHHPNSYAQTLFHCSQEHLIAFNLKKNNAAGLDHSGQPNMLYPFQESAWRLSVRRHLVLASCFDSYFSTVTPTLIIWTSNGIDHSLFLLLVPGPAHVRPASSEIVHVFAMEDKSSSIGATRTRSFQPNSNNGSLRFQTTPFEFNYSSIHWSWPDDFNSFVLLDKYGKILEINRHGFEI